jgi:ribosomal subunit interface protein
MLPLQIAVHNTEMSPDAEADIRQRVERLSRYYDRLMSCRVTVDVPQSRRRIDAVLYGVRIDVTVPGGEIVVNRQPRAEFETALDGAFQAMRRRLQDYARRQRGAVKARAM